MKKIVLLLSLFVFLFSSCSKHCPTLLDGPINDEEKKYYLSSAQTFLYKNQFGDTGYVYAEAPRFKIIPVVDYECDRPGNHAVNQLWKLPDGIEFDAFFQHDNGMESSQYLRMSLGSNEIFRFNVIKTDFVTIEINTQYFRNTLVDSTTDPFLSPDIKTIWYGKHTGMIQFEKWNGEIWSRQKMIN